MFTLPHVASRIFGTPLFVDERKAAAILRAVGARIVPGGIVLDGVEPIDHRAFASGRPSAGRVGDPLGRAYENASQGDRILPTIIDGIAVIPIEGTLVHKGKWLGMSSGETSYEGIQTSVQRARRDARVKGVVFEVDSFGGEVAGAFDTAQMIAELSREKPTLAILTDYALSAGYLMASAARRIVAPETGYAGSIGVITMHVDYSAAMQAEGVKVTLLYSGAHKADANPFESLPAPVAEKIQGDLDRLRDNFAAFVGRQRARRLTKADALATEAQSFLAADALERGLIDGVGRPSEAFDAFVRAVNRAGSAII